MENPQLPFVDPPVAVKTLGLVVSYGCRVVGPDDCSFVPPPLEKKKHSNDMLCLGKFMHAAQRIANNHP